jgi:hypothetical protein
LKNIKSKTILATVLEMKKIKVPVIVSAGGKLELE